jgi:hypothetical protein
MPWPTFANMTDRDLLAIYTYLSAIPCNPGPSGLDLSCTSRTFATEIEEKGRCSLYNAGLNDPEFKVPMRSRSRVASETNFPIGPRFPERFGRCMLAARLTARGTARAADLQFFCIQTSHVTGRLLHR